MKGKYKYNASGLKQAMKQNNIRKVEVQRLFGYVNNIQINRWIDGNDIYISKACEICNRFGLDFFEIFLLYDDTEKAVTPAMSEVRTGNQRATAEDLQEERQQNRTLTLPDNATLKDLLDFMEKAQQNTFDLYQRSVEKERENTSRQILSLTQRLEETIVDKNKEIMAERDIAQRTMLENKELRMKYEELSRQYKELEMKCKGYPSPIGVAESPYLNK